MNKPENPTAFPVSHLQYTSQGMIICEKHTEGMTLRDYFANSAMIALINKQDPKAFITGHTKEAIEESSINFLNSIVSGAYYYADAMLAERSKNGE